MSTRESIHYDKDGEVHLFADCMEEYEISGLHLDMCPVRPSDAIGQYGDFRIGVRGDGMVCVGLRIPANVCEAIADYVLRRREFQKGRAP